MGKTAWKILDQQFVVLETPFSSSFGIWPSSPLGREGREASLLFGGCKRRRHNTEAGWKSHKEKKKLRIWKIDHGQDLW